MGRIAFDAFAQDEAVIAGEFAGVIATPQDQIVGLGDDRQFLIVLSVSHHRSLLVYASSKTCFFIFRPLRGKL
jgi:hypothetical protein